MNITLTDSVNESLKIIDEFKEIKKEIRKIEKEIEKEIEKKIEKEIEKRLKDWKEIKKD
ncbi:hypothetical protein [Methanimicrococcus blatticola]|uniref:Uncharacterized protein n=1 Tax=Methanimicrococcus blatticola TaxID=91560 RepID=A0A484F6D1_9EURY|nr:hypothetical protein [Methanimicrococcus blatticola]MBZ3935595.1 hypothetical protein [Methanimicrococcus blatticola]MCC2509236.1 hypothetical protein [Methanimicrococcus blatticola]TDQ69398.1 hypothetical protein C7391_0723 [Methanimicrococcus blatticola]